MVKVACGLSDAHTAQEDRYFDYRQALATYTCHLSIGFNNAGILPNFDWKEAIHKNMGLGPRTQKGIGPDCLGQITYRN